MIFTNKKEARKWAKSVRDGLPDVSADVCRILIEFLSEKRVTSLLTHNISGSTRYVERVKNHGTVKNVLAYHAFGSEIKLDQLVKALSITWSTTHSQKMTLHPWESASVYNKNILDPADDAPIIPYESIEIALIPGLAFDKSGNRLGYGLGFYDQLLKKLPNALLVGVVHETLFINRLLNDPWDIKMAKIATENKIIDISDS